MKILMAPVNIAGQPITLIKELRRRNVDATLLQYVHGAGHKFKYETDRIVDMSKRDRRDAEIDVVKQCLSEDFDIFHFWMSSFFSTVRLEDMAGMDILFLRNHGVVFCGESIERMTIVGLQLEVACRQMLEVSASGISYDWPDDEEQARKSATMNEPRNIGLYFEHFTNKLAATQALGHPSLPMERRGQG